MPIMKCDLWDVQSHPTMIVVTTNGSIRYDGCLVMEHGAVRGAPRRGPTIAKLAGDAIRMYGEYVTGVAFWDYGYLTITSPISKSIPGIGIFRVKALWSDRTELTIIRNSLVQLVHHCLAFPDVQYRLNYPGIEPGWLSRRQVAPLLVNLPENLTICYR